MTTTEKGGAIAWMAGNSVASNLLMVVLLVGGFLISTQLKQEVFPEFTLDIVSVRVPYPGAGPEEVEQGIVLAIEEAVRGVDGVEEVTATAQESMGTVSVELIRGTDLQRAAQDIKNEVDRITSFPEDAERPVVSIPQRRREVISLILYGETEHRVLRELAEQVRDRLLQDDGITLVELGGVRPLEISVEVPQEKLRAHGLTLGQVANQLRRTAVELPGGGIKTEGGEVLLRMMERRDFGPEFTDIPIVTKDDGSDVRLGDIATIVDGFAETDTGALFNGQPAVLIRVYRVGKETPIQVSDTVQRHVEELRAELPPGIGVTTWNDRSDIFRQRVNLLLRNGAIGLVLVFVLLGLFLETRLAFWVMMGIPISFLGSFLILPLTGVSINMISLFAFIIALGIVVDDAVVVGENIYEHHQRGMPFGEAAVLGARSVAVPVVFSILTNVAAFTPLFFVPGFMGKVFRVIPSVVIMVFLLSLVESLLILPAHLGHQKDISGHGVRGWIHRRQQAFSRRFMHFVRDGYGPFLDFTLRHRYTTVALGIAVLATVIGYAASGRLGFSLFPRVDAEYAIVTAQLPYGSSADRTRAVQQRLLDTANAVAERNGGDQLVDGVLAFVGNSQSGGESHTTEVLVYLTKPDIRPIGTAEFIKQWREETGPIAGLESITFKSDAGGPGSGAALTVELSHRDVEVLERASAELAEAIEEFPQAKDINDGYSPGKNQYDFTLLPEGESLGLTALEVARQVRNSYYGAEALRQQRGRNEVKVMVRRPKSERISEYDLEELIVRTPSGGEVPLREVVELKRGRAYTTIDRRQGKRVVTVTSDVTPPSAAGLVLAGLKAEALPGLVQKHAGLSYGFEGQQAEMRKSMGSLKYGFAGAMLVVYALLAIPFRSYVQPLIIMVSIPFGIVGAVLGHMIMGFSLSVLSMFGIVALSGVVVNDSLILIDYANGQRKEGKTLHDAIHAAGVRRFRPILLTTLTTFGGLAPMIFETSRQARFLIPMAISLGYGILFATFITLLLVPSLYLILEDVRWLLLAKPGEPLPTEE